MARKALPSFPHGMAKKLGGDSTEENATSSVEEQKSITDINLTSYDFDLSTIGIKQDTLNYSKGGKSNRYKLMRGLGSHWVSNSDVADAKVGYDTLPDVIKDAYKPHERFWLAVAATRNPEILSNEKSVLNVPQAVKENLEELVKRGLDQVQGSETRAHPDIITISLYQALGQMDNAYASIVGGVKEYLSKSKQDRDIKGALSLAVFGATIAPLAQQYEGILAETGAQMPYKPW
ncbi:MAG: hypothetical protein V1831_03060 [Candidatus Woesearchaeota archaeon]